ISDFLYSSLAQPHLFFPYTTLFRSLADFRTDQQGDHAEPLAALQTATEHVQIARLEQLQIQVATREQHGVEREQRQGHRHTLLRSEEHTSELQSRENLVCRLLLEKK